MSEYSALTARMLKAEQNAKADADAAEESAGQARQLADGEMAGTALSGEEKKLLLEILQMAADKNSGMQPAVDELAKLWKEETE